MVLLSVAWQTVTDCIRQPFFLISFLLTALIASALPILSQFSLYDQRKMLLDSLFGLVFIVGVMLVILLADHSVGADFSKGRPLLLFSKPIGNTNYVFGKLVGNVFCLLLFFFFAWLTIVVINTVVYQNFFFNYYRLIAFFVVTLLALTTGGLVNFYFNKNFSSTTIFVFLLYLFILASSLIFIQRGQASQLLSMLKVFVLLVTFVMLYLGFSSFCATIFSIGGQCMMVIIFTSIGLFGPSVLPSFNSYWTVDLFHAQQQISWAYIFEGMLHVLLYQCFFSVLFISWLRHKELAASK